MWAYNGLIIIAIAVILNLVLVKRIMDAFPGKKLWLVVVLCSVGDACYLLPYFAMGRNFYAPEVAAGALLFLICFAFIPKTKMADEELEELDTKRILLLLVIPMTGMLVLDSRCHRAWTRWAHGLRGREPHGRERNLRGRLCRVPR